MSEEYYQQSSRQPPHRILKTQRTQYLQANMSPQRRSLQRTQLSGQKLKLIRKKGGQITARDDYSMQTPRQDSMAGANRYQQPSQTTNQYHYQQPSQTTNQYQQPSQTTNPYHQLNGYRQDRVIYKNNDSFAPSERYDASRAAPADFSTSRQPYQQYQGNVQPTQMFDRRPQGEEYESRQPGIDQYDRSQYQRREGGQTQYERRQEEQEELANSRYFHSASKDIPVIGRILASPKAQAPLSRSQTPRVRKAQSLTNTIKKKYLMHTFYPAQKKQYYDYNDEGYKDPRRQEIRQRLEEKARRAFERAVYEQDRREQAPRRPTRPRKFQVEDNSRIQHRNSGILQDLRLHDVSRQQLNLNSKRTSNHNNSMSRIQRQERVIQMSIDPKRQQQQHYDDYQMGKEKSISHYVDDRHVSIPSKHIIAQHNKQEDDSFLNFRPPKKQEQKNEKNQQQVLEVRSKKGSQLSDYRSIDMMEINSNCRIPEKDDKKEGEKNDRISQDNRSLGINTLRSFEQKKKSKIISEPSLQSSLNSETNSRESDLSSSSHSQHKLSKSGSEMARPSNYEPQIRDKIDPNIESQQNFSKHKLKSSHSLSEVLGGGIEVYVNQPRQSKVSIENSNMKGLKSDSPQFIGSRQAAEEQIELSKMSKKSSKVSKKQQSKVSNKQQSKISQNQESKISKEESKISNNISISLQEGSHKKIKRLKRASDIKIQSTVPQATVLEALPLKVAPAIEQFSPKIAKQSKLKSNNSEVSVNRSQNSAFNRSKNRQLISGSSQYNAFTQVRQFMQDEQSRHELRKDQQDPSEISIQLEEVLTKIEEHLYKLNCIAEIVIMVPDLYDFETIYDPRNQWLLLQSFLTLKKFLFERTKTVEALRGGKNCFKLLDSIIQDHSLKAFIEHPYVKSIASDLQQFNNRLGSILRDFLSFLQKFRGLPQKAAFYNLRPFNNADELGVLLGQYSKEVNNLKCKKKQQFNDGDVDDNEVDMVIDINERIFRLMEVSFILGNLAGKEQKAIEKDEQLYQQQDRFNDYLSEYQQLFEQMVMIFR